MKIKPAPEDNIGFQMAPMIDIVFLLIIFFMLAAKQSQAQFKKINAPVAEESKVSQNRGDRGTITINADEVVFLGAAPGTLEEITELVQERVTENPKFKVVLRVDKNVEHKVVRDVLKACADGGALDVIFAAYQTEK